MTTPLDDDRTVRESLGGPASDMSSSWRDRTDQSRLDNAYGRAIEGFRLDLAERGLAGVSVGSVATRSDVSPASIVSSFGGVVGLLRAPAFGPEPTSTSTAWPR